MYRIAALIGSLIVGASFAECGELTVTEEEIRAAISRAMPLLERSAREFTKQRECFSCHHQTLPILAMKETQKKGCESHPEELQAQIDWTAKFLERNQERFREGKGTGGQADTAGYALWALAAANYPADQITESVAEYLLLRHKDRDHWPPTSQRPPTEASHFTTTFLAIQGLSNFACCEQQQRARQRIEEALKWVVATPAEDTEDFVFRLRALQAAGGESKNVKEAADHLVARQREDGGWAQLDTGDSDAYATASALAALVDTGNLPATDARYQRGLRFLLKTQLEDGSWRVATRSKPIQEYFESGFPHGADQFISISATAWSVVALAKALPDA